MNAILDTHMARLPDTLRLLNKAEKLRHMPHTWESQKGKTLEQLIGWGGTQFSENVIFPLLVETGVLWVPG